MNVLLNNYQETGSDLAGFASSNAKMAEITKDLVVRGRDITFLSLCDIPACQKEGRAAFYVLDAETLKEFEDGHNRRVGYIIQSEIGEELLEELRSTTGLMLMVNGEKYVVSDMAIPTLTIRASVSGDMTVNDHNVFRDMHLAYSIIKKDEKIHLVYREIQIGTKEDGTPVMVRKVFAGLGGAYKLIPQTILTDAVNVLMKESTMGTVAVEGWSIDHAFSELILKLPEAAEDFKDAYKLPSVVTPGVLLATSDIGRSSIIVRGVYFIGRSYVITDEVMTKHAGNVDVSAILKDINETVMANIRKLPEAMCELVGMEVTDYSKIDLTSADGQEANSNALCSLLERVVKKAFGNKVLPQKWQKDLLDCLTAEVDPARPYTMYDVADTLMSVPDRVEGLDITTTLNVRKACAKIPYILLDGAPEAKEPTIVLT